MGKSDLQNQMLRRDMQENGKGASAMMLDPIWFRAQVYFMAHIYHSQQC